MSRALARPVNSVAPPHWNRWLVPPAALSVHLAIGQVYAWSVFKPPLEKTLDLTGTQSALPFQLGIAMLGLSAAFGGNWVDRVGPRQAKLVSTVCFSVGFLVAALGVVITQFWLVVLGYGFIGGIGLGIGYISPVSTLIRWFPDRPGMATGIATMGFGGGALIASPLANQMFAAFGTNTGGIATTFLVHGLVYATFMSLGTWLVRVPEQGWQPPGWGSDHTDVADDTGTTAGVSANNALKTPQFWLLWLVLCLNVTAGIGLMEKAAPMIQDFFAETSAPVSIGAAAGFIALLSLANLLGRLIWSSTSDVVGRKNTYRFYLGVGAVLYLVIALTTSMSKTVFILAAMMILSFYGAGFSTMPAYLKDLFGPDEVGAIHGRILTAWSAAGVLGPLIINMIADGQEAAGKEGPQLYTTSLFIMMGLLIVGFVANELVRAVHPKFFDLGMNESLSNGRGIR